MDIASVEDIHSMKNCYCFKLLQQSLRNRCKWKILILDPKTIVMNNMNTIRYEYRISSKHTVFNLVTKKNCCFHKDIQNINGVKIFLKVKAS